MIEEVRLSVQNDVQVVEITFEVGNQNFNGRIRITISDGSNGGGPYFGSTIRKVVTGHGGEYAMLESHFENGVGYAGRFGQVEFGWFAGLDGAKAAGSRANVAENHQGRSSPRPTFAHVGALSTLTYGV
jgi:hypothetical protein